MILKLVLKSLRYEKIRLGTAALGVAAATGLFVWSLGLVVTSAGQSRERVRRMTAPYTCWVSAGHVGVRPDRKTMMRQVGRSSVAQPLPPDLVSAVQALPEVEVATPYKTIRTVLDYRPGGRILQGPPLVSVLTLAATSGCPYAEATVTGRWPDPASEALEAAVCTAVFTPRRLTPPPLGSMLTLITPSGTVEVKITAYVDFKEALPGFPTSFVTLGAMRQASGGTYDPAPDLLLCKLRDGADTKGVKAVAEPVYKVLERKDVEAGYSSDKLQNFKRQAPLLLTLSILTALCMLVNALTIGVEQKRRVLALLRAAGMTAKQVSQVVMLEGAVVAFAGWIVGLAAGWMILAAFVARTPDAFPAGVIVGWVTPVSSLIGVALVAAVSLIWPCRHAVRIKPLDALAEQEDEPKPISWRRSLLGFILLFPMLVLVLPMPITAMTRSVLLLALGLPLHVLGLLLVLPSFVSLMERAAAPAVSAMLALDPHLLRRRISRHFSRTAGMVLTLAVGLGAFVSIHIWGGSMMAPFIPSHEFPDAIVSILPNGVPASAAQGVSQLKGVGDGRCLALEAAQFDLSEALTAQVARVSGRVPESPNVLLMGTDPQAAFGGERPLAPFRFVEGDRQAAAAAMMEDGTCVITKMFSRESGLHAGDTLTIVKRPSVRGRRGAGEPGGVAQDVAFKIVGVADLNWHLVTARARLRGRNGMSGMTMGPVFVSERDARRLTGNTDTTYFLWLNLSKEYRSMGALQGSQLLEADIRNALEIDEANTVCVHHRDEIEDGTIAHGAQLIGDMARAPFWSLLVLSTGFITLLIASFQASAKEIAVMRAVGMTRSQLGRMLLGEALLVGLCGIVLSLLSGFCIGWTFTGWTRAWFIFGGLPVSLSVPWLVILRGVCFALALCVVMAALPIVWLVRRRKGALIATTHNS
jgi:putative ABC transport system permease protein